ncbi:hypothetical protein AVEN_70183-1 [Araneus ventricosus]|uniref:Uncharacterized protein n=1 Tax=Araneus ventricosus TaxID=182803 RepID=A0A4Y2FFF1_ARAVE|nr:hypothetical protein AVEN_70183-1 [Araneus ventricosus]
MKSRRRTMKKCVLDLHCRLPVFSLQRMSLIRIITTLCNNRQLLRLITKCQFHEDFGGRPYARQGREWAAVESMANEMVSQICSCGKLNDRIIELLWPVCYNVVEIHLCAFHWESISTAFLLDN